VADVTFDRSVDLLLTGEDAVGEQVRGIRVMAAACIHCAFIRLHSQDVITQSNLQISEEDH
jgi:hypothetical protein